jgi:predicted outer membrane repeat protein
MRKAVRSLLVVSSAAFAFGHAPLSVGAVIHVDSTLGTFDLNSCTLVDAFGAASAHSAVGTCAAGEGNDIIELPQDAIITLLGTSLPASALLPAVTGTLLVVGNGSTVSSEYTSCDSDSPRHRLLVVSDGATLYANGLTFENGCANDAHDGGAILAAGSLDLQNVTFTNNASEANGGAVAASGPFLHVFNSSFFSNTSDHDGGALFAAASGNDVLVSGNFFSGNSAVDGGAAWFGGVSFKLINSTFLKNSAFFGGAIEAGTGSINFSTFVGNVAYNGGAALYGSWHDTLVANNIFAKSPGGDPGLNANCATAFDATITFVYTNVSDDTSCGNTLVTSSESALAFGAVGLHGGTTATIPLGIGSLAIDAATPCHDADGALESFDQRGVLRNAYGTCDMGAFQHDGNVYPVVVPAPLGAGDLLVSNGTYITEYSRTGEHIRDFWPPLQLPMPAFPESVDAAGLTSFGIFFNGYNGNAFGLYAVQTDTWQNHFYSTWSDSYGDAANKIAHVGNRWFLLTIVDNIEAGVIVLENGQEISRLNLHQPISDLKAGLDGFLYVLVGATIQKFDPVTLQSAGSLDISASLAGNDARSIAVGAAGEKFVYRSDGRLLKLDVNGAQSASTDCVVTGNSIPCADAREIALSQDHEIFLVPSTVFAPPPTATITMVDDTFSTGSNFAIDIPSSSGAGYPVLVVSPLPTDEIFSGSFEP